MRFSSWVTEHSTVSGCVRTLRMVHRCVAALALAVLNLAALPPGPVEG